MDATGGTAETVSELSPATGNAFFSHLIPEGKATANQSEVVFREMERKTQQGRPKRDWLDDRKESCNNNKCYRLWQKQAEVADDKTGEISLTH